jgi:hypothetical protein
MSRCPKARIKHGGAETRGPDDEQDPASDAGEAMGATEELTNYMYADWVVAIWAQVEECGKKLGRNGYRKLTATNES